MRKSETHKHNLVRTAMRLFRRQGYASTGLQQILKESGAPKGSMYYYFPDGKEALGAAAVDMAGGLMLEMLTGLASRHATPRAFLQAYCKTMAGWMAESDFRSGSPVTTTLLETVPKSKPITGACQQAYDSWIEIVAGVYEKSGTPQRDAKSKAELIVMAMEGALILSRVRKSSRPILDVVKLA